jgi:hypothetical protein
VVNGQKNAVKEPAESEMTIQLPRKVSRRKSVAREPGRAKEVLQPEASVKDPLQKRVEEARSLRATAPGPLEAEEMIELLDQEAQSLHATVPGPLEAEEKIELPDQEARSLYATAPGPLEAEEMIELPDQEAQSLHATAPGPLEAEETIELPDQEARSLHAAAPGPLEAEMTLQLPRKATWRQRAKARITNATTLQLHFASPNARASLEEDLLAPLDETTQSGELDDDEVMQHQTWQKVVPHKTPPVLPAVSVPAQGRSRLPKSRAARSFFWLSNLVLLALVLSGAFGIAVSFGRSIQKNTATPQPSLLATPATIALGGIVTLRGLHFTPGGMVTLSRDRRVSLVDTSDASTLRADAQGSFSDTVVADPVWLSGVHTLYATDAQTHKQALVPVTLTGTNALQGPPHLVLSTSVLDLGSGDQTINSSKLLALSNAGGSLANWQASVSQSWLQITPKSGSIASGKHMSVTVAASRTNLASGSYQANVVFTSDAGQITMVVKMTVTALQPSHEAIMQLSTATLAFRGAAPGAQTITITNPGIMPLSWGAGVSGRWLWIAPAGGTIPSGGAQRVTVGAVTTGLASGVYKGTISFWNQGAQPVQGSPQYVYASLTVTSACTLAPSASSLGFSGAQGGSNPASKSLSIGVAKGCTQSQNWTATASTKWLSVSAVRGVTPATVKVNVNTSGLASGTYQGTLTFTNALGSKTVGVTLTVTSVSCTLAGPSALTLQGTAGQTTPLTQNENISASGGCTHVLDWTSSVSGGSWLSASSSGTFTSSATVSIQAKLAGLSAGTYNGTVTITVVDSVTKQSIGTLKISVTLIAQTPAPPATPCTLGTPSATVKSFTANLGSNPAPSSTSFTISVTGSCTDDITITPQVDSGWLSITGSRTIASGSTATFTITVASDSLKAGSYTGTITLTASGGINGSPRTVTVTLTVQ